MVIRVIGAAGMLALACGTGSAQDYVAPAAGTSFAYDYGEESGTAEEVVLFSDGTGFVSLVLTPHTDFLMRAHYGIAYAPCGSGHPLADEIGALFPLEAGTETESGAVQVSGQGAPFELDGQSYETWVITENTGDGDSYSFTYSPELGISVDGLVSVKRTELDLDAMGISAAEIEACR